MITELFFTSPSAAALFALEFSGQISDGQWENARPYNHWEWITDVKYNIDKNHIPGYSGPFHKKKYNIKPWLNLYKKKNYEWAIRVYYIAKFASILSEEDLNKVLNSEHNMDCIIEMLPEDKSKITYEEFIRQEYDEKKWRNMGYGRAILTKDYFDKYYESNYTMEDFKRDLYSCNETINNFIN